MITDEKYCDIPAAATYLKISSKTIRNWVSAKRVPYIKCGGRILFSTEALDAWMASQAVPAIRHAKPVQ